METICNAVLRETEYTKLKALFFLINDILFNSSKITTAWSYKKEFEFHLANLFNHINQIQKQKTLTSKQFNKTLKRLLKLWLDKSIFDQKLVLGWESTLNLQP